MDTKLYGEMAEMERTHWWFLGRSAVIKDILLRFKKNRSTLLDVGAGTCLNTAAFKRIGFQAVALESHPEALNLARTVAPDIEIIDAPFPSPRIESNKYDVVTLLDVLEHLSDDADSLQEVHRILAPNGIVLITVPAFMFLWTSHDERAHHYRRYRRTELLTKLKLAGFEPTLVSYYNFFLFPPIAFVRLIQKFFVKKNETSDFTRSPRILNSLFATLFGAERFLLRFTRLPFGVSLVAVARKKEKKK